MTDTVMDSLKRLSEACAPFFAVISREFHKWDVSIDVLGEAGWLPHYTTPFDRLVECDSDSVQTTLVEYYGRNWPGVRSEMESRLSGYDVDCEAKATFREALDAHEAGLYRCVCRVLFPEIERIFRVALVNGKVGHMSGDALIKKLVDDRHIGDFTPGGLYILPLFRHLTKSLKSEEDSSEYNGPIYGLFGQVKTDDDRERLEQDPIPNRHAAIHGLVVYSSAQNSLNMMFIADYVFQVISTLRTDRNQLNPNSTHSGS